MIITDNLRLAVANLLCIDVIFACTQEEDFVSYMSEHQDELLELTIETVKLMVDVLNDQYKLPEFGSKLDRFCDTHTGLFALTDDGLIETLEEIGLV